MRQHLLKIRDNIIQQGWKDNKHKIRKYEYVEMWKEGVSIPSLYRIIKVAKKK